MPVNSFENYPMSWKPSLDKSSRVLFRALAEQLEQDIKSGVLLPGTKLPPIRELADFLDINFNTVSKAFKVCALKGLLSAAVGRGTYVSYDALSNPHLLTEGNPLHLIEMGAILVESSANRLLLTQLKNMLNEPGADRWFGHNRPYNTIWQKDAAVTLMEKCGVSASHENILFSNGCQNALTAALAGMFKHGDKIGVDPYTYPGIKASAAMLGIQLIPIKQTNGEMDPDSLLLACKTYELKGLYLIPNCHAPTTHTMSLPCRRAIAEIAKAQNLIVLEDGTYQMTDHRFPPISRLAPEQSIFIVSLTTTVAPGLRLAYVKVPRRFASAMADALYNLNTSISNMMAELASRIIVSGQLEPILELHREKTAERNLLVNQYFSKEQCAGENTCIFRWLHLPEPFDSASFEHLALKHGVQVYSANRFAVGITEPVNAVCLSICSPDTLEELERGLQILAGLLR